MDCALFEPRNINKIPTYSTVVSREDRFPILINNDLILSSLRAATGYGEGISKWTWQWRTL